MAEKRKKADTKTAKGKSAERPKAGDEVLMPGAPSVEPPSLELPTEPREPLPPKSDQVAPAVVTATGEAAGAEPTARAQAGAYLTTAQGVRLYETDHSLKAGERGPTLLQDHHFRDKITHFDHERIPERVVHARGAGAHGVFQSYGTAAKITKAAFLAKDVETPVFVRFSTVLGSRGSADTVRDTRGFAVKFYTAEGNYDLVGNNMPVFFIQDAIKFPDIIHAGKPHPDREIPQAQSAHDTFWDFVSLHTEAQHHAIWNLSDRGIPASFRMMEGFGVHTFRMVDAEGGTTLVKFHWKPKAGVHSLVWEEAQMISGGDPDFHRRDLADAIELGNFPQWEIGIQVFPDTEDQMFEGIDLLDPTKLVPEELAPVQPIGLLTLNGNPTNFFAETEQVAFHPGHLVPGIDVVNDPLLQGRLFSYLDTQLTRLGGPNFAQIPVNRPVVPVNDMLRDGFHQDAVHAGVAPYRPNSLDGGVPFLAGEEEQAFVEVPAPVAESTKVRAAAVSFDDHFSQARLFFQSMTPVEKDHIIQAYTFELGKVFEKVICERQLQCLANIDTTLCEAVAKGLGMPAPKATIELPEVEPSPALSQIRGAFPVTGRKVGIIADESCDLAEVAAMRDTVVAAGMLPLVIGPHGGELAGNGGPVPVDRTFLTTRSFEYDAVVLAGAIAPAEDALASLDAKAGNPSGRPEVEPRVLLMLAEMYRHSKAIGALPAGEYAVSAAGIDAAAAGVVVGDAKAVVDRIAELLGMHRVWERFPARST